MRRLLLPLAGLVLLLLTGWWGWVTVVHPRTHVPREGELPELANRAREVGDPDDRDPLGPAEDAGGADAGAGSEPDVEAEDASPPELVEIDVLEPPAPPEPVVVVPDPVVPEPVPLPPEPAGDTVIVGNTWSRGDVGPDIGAREVPAGYGWVGTPRSKVVGYERSGGENAPVALRYEAPRHKVWFETFGISPYEASNRTWRRFLQETALVKIETPYGDAGTLRELVVELMGERAPDDWDVDATLLQLYRANQGALDLQFRELEVLDAGGERDVDRTFARVADAPLPDGLRLRFYDRPPPRHWVDLDFAAGDASRAVRDLSPADALACAWWIGLHLPSELEWEYACRGRNGWDFPWGNGRGRFEDWVHGGALPDSAEELRTFPVRSLPEGASWVGAHHMLGNVAEWTSSWLDPYPESALPALPVPVRRGGSAADTDPLLVRPALRGWPPDAGTPSFRTREAWTGLRLAAYGQDVGDSRAVNLVMEARATGRIAPDLLQRDAYGGTGGRITREFSAANEIRGLRRGAKSFFLLPLARVAHGSPDGTLAAGLPDDVESLDQLVGASVLGTPILLGLARIDLPGVEAWASRTGRDARSGLKLDPSEVEVGSAWLGLVDGHLALVSLDASGVRYLTRTAVSPGSFSVLEKTARPRATVDLDAAGGTVTFTLEVPVDASGFGVLRTRIRLTGDPDVLLRVPRWTEVERR